MRVSLVKSFLIILFTIVPTLSSASSSETRNVTAEYHSYWNKLETEANYFEKNGSLRNLKQYKFLFVPGFLSDVVIKLGELPGIKFTKLGQYFDEQLNFMKSAGLHAELIELESEAGIVHNSKLISKAIKSSEKPVIIISHSKGGIDTLEALIRNQKLQEKVKAWISIQSAFWGSPIADCVIEGKIIGPIAKTLLKKLGGSDRSLLDLTTSSRHDYMKANQSQISSLLKRVPTISFASYKDEEPWSWDTLLEPFRDIMLKEYFLDNDGLVPWQSAVLTGADFIKVSGIDHAVPVMYCTFIEFDRVKFLKTLLLMANQRILEK